ncbi:flagellar hook-basal body complex protein FliE [Leptonema illini]
MQIGSAPKDPEHMTTTFAQALNEALGNVEGLSKKSEDLTTKAIYDPDSVEAHEVIIASQKARFALNLTKTIADGAVRTFRELTNPR